ncbi:MAG TPA: Rieske 2Fe-2S domain-containing protein [Stellaceae bacterium]|nr:Rieske 2Fe-2S domain-containing protein [Stellaceae bacterium]
MSDSHELITRTGPGTPMGELMRQYWIPAARSSELVADGAPVRIALLGEKLLAFRDSAGRVGVMDHRCPHRCASLFYGRNEENGLRCVYHGWKYDVDGNCLDQANVPPHQDFKDKVKAKAYLARERNDVVWIYMGDRNRAPDLPPFEACLAPRERVGLRFVQRRCNWLQAVEGDLDTSHVGLLHFGAAKPSSGLDDSHKDIVVNRAPEYRVTETPHGLTYGAYRPSATVPGGTYWRVAHYLFPFWIMPPVTSLEHNVMVRAFIPMDDEHCMFVGFESLSYARLNDRTRNDGVHIRDNLQPNTTDWFGRYRMVECAENDYLIDRDIQRETSFTGIDGIHTQDQTVTESMGGIVDRSFENLAPSDIAVARNRRMLLNTVQAFQKGVRPPSADNPQLYAKVRGGYYTTTKDGDWLALHKEEAEKLRQAALAHA